MQNMRYTYIVLLGVGPCMTLFSLIRKDTGAIFCTQLPSTSAYRTRRLRGFQSLGQYLILLSNEHSDNIKDI